MKINGKAEHEIGLNIKLGRFQVKLISKNKMKMVNMYKTKLVNILKSSESTKDMRLRVLQLLSETKEQVADPFFIFIFLLDQMCILPPSLGQ